MTEYDIANIGKEGSRLKENEAYKAAMSAMHEQINLQWKNTPIRDKEGQTLILQLARCADIFESALSGLIESGKFAQSKIDLDLARETQQGIRKYFPRAA